MKINKRKDVTNLHFETSAAEINACKEEYCKYCLENLKKDCQQCRLTPFLMAFCGTKLELLLGGENNNDTAEKAD